MTDDEKRQRIAEMCGWTFIERLAFTGIPKGSRGNADARVIPDYLASLDAMAAAEATLTDGEFHAYGWELHKLIFPVDDDSISYEQWLELGNSLSDWSLAPMARATARQRAEAFLRVKGALQ